MIEEPFVACSALPGRPPRLGRDTRGERFFFGGTRVNASTGERFWNFVHCEPNTGCWLWAGAETHGYGSLFVDGSVQGAHRVSYQLHKGPIPPGKYVLHTCDVRSCVNPDHLYIGTHADNTRDAVARQRYVRGEQHSSNKLAEQEVREIRALRSRFSQRRLAALYGVNKTTVYEIQARKSWKHV